MNNILRTIIIDDSQNDAELILFETSKNYKVEHAIIDNEQALRRALSEKDWDIVLCDFSMPNFDPYKVLNILRDYDHDLPLIVISGVIGEDNAIKLLKAGCSDCITKINMTRLPGVIDREVKEARVRKENRRLNNNLNYERDRAKKYLDTANIMFLALNKDETVQAINKKGCEILGFSEQNLLGKNWFDHFIPQNNISEVRLVFSKIINGEHENLKFFENTVITASGEERDISWHNALMKDEAGNITGILSAGNDVTDRKKAVQELKASEARLKIILDTSPFPTAVVDTNDDKIKYWSQSAVKLFGHNPKTSQEWYELAYPDPDYRQEVIDHWKPFLEIAQYEAEAVNTGEYDIVCKDGSVKICEIFARFIPGNLIVTLNDITERKNAEEALKDSENRYKAIFNKALYGIQLTDREGKILQSNPAHHNIHGYENGELVGRYIWDLMIDETHRQQAKDFYNKIIQEQPTPQIYVSQDLTKNGLEIYTQVVWDYIRDTEGNITCILSIIDDITERRKSELALQKERNRLTSIIEGTNVGTWEWNVRTGETIFNKKWAQIVGYTLEELAPISIKTWEELTYPDDLEESNNLLEQHFSGGMPYYDFECQMKHKDGHWVAVHDRGKVMTWTEAGKPLWMFGTHEDISKRKLSAEALKKSEEKFRSLFEESPFGIILCEAVRDEKGKLIDYIHVQGNKSTVNHLGLEEKDIIGKTALEIADNNQTRDYMVKFDRMFLTKKPIDYTQYISIVNRTLQVTAFPMNSDQFILNFIDVTEKSKQLKQIEFLSFHDELTGIYNRRFFEEEMKRMDTKRNLPLSLIMGDVNGLKLINDSFGHKNGDALLKKTANAIKEGCRGDDVIARIGGDEFVVILPNSNEVKAMEIINRISGIINKEQIMGINISVSFGFGTKTDSAQNLRDILKDAEDHLYKQKLYESSSMRNETIKLISNTLHAKNSRELIHSQKVSELCEALSSKMGFSDDAVKVIKLAGLMHDIGKIGIEDKVLNKHGKLNDDEYLEVKRHPEIGYRILSSVNEFSELSEYVLQHHENWDGSGYPQGLKGEAIKIEARIIGVADAYAAMTNARTYGTIRSNENAVGEIKRCAGTQFDPTIAKVFVENVLGKSW